MIYGQDTLFQLLQRTEHGPTLARAAIRDWPSVPWRGRPQTSLNNYFREGELDCYLTARSTGSTCEKAFMRRPRTPLDKERISQVIREAKRRGLLTYAVVNCGVSPISTINPGHVPRVHPAWGGRALALLRRQGAGRRAGEACVRGARARRQHGITGPRIMINPPKGSYQTIADESNKDFNRRIMAIPGMEHALWTGPVHDARGPAQARSIGLKARLGCGTTGRGLLRIHLHPDKQSHNRQGLHGGSRHARRLEPPQLRATRGRRRHH